MSAFQQISMLAIERSGKQQESKNQFAVKSFRQTLDYSSSLLGDSEVNISTLKILTSPVKWLDSGLEALRHGLGGAQISDTFLFRLGSWHGCVCESYLEHPLGFALDKHLASIPVSMSKGDNPFGNRRPYPVIDSE